MAKPQEGADFTYDGAEPIGVDSGALMPGTVVTVREVVAAKESGAHNHREDAAVIEWDAPALIRVDGGGVELGTSRRAMSVSVVDFTRDFKLKKGA